MKLRERLLGLVLGLALSGAALAHAMLDRSAPPVGGSVKGPPARVDLWFTESLEAAFSRLRVLDAAGHRVDGGDARVDKADGTHLSVSVGSLPPGRYRVVWRVVSVDTHATEGDFTFDVAP